MSAAALRSLKRNLQGARSYVEYSQIEESGIRFSKALG
jgi:hypothetical protein